MKCGPFSLLIGVLLFHGTHICAGDPCTSRSIDAADGEGATRQVTEQEGGALEGTEAKALANFARRLDKHGDVHSAAKSFVEEVKAVRAKGRLTGQISVEPTQREFTVGKAITFDVHTIFRAAGAATYDWHWAAFEMTGQAPYCRVITSGGGSASGRTRLTVELTGPWRMCGNFELLYVIFGRKLPHDSFDFLDSVRIRYTVKPADS